MPVDATHAELRAAYLKLARTWHPDLHNGAQSATAERKMRQINDAWSVLGSRHERTAYDRELAVTTPAGHAQAGYGHRGRSHFQAFDDEPITDRDFDLDETPFAQSKKMPQWMSMMPILMVIAAVMLFGAGLLVNARSIIATAAAIFALGAIGFLALPLWVMSQAERDPKL